MLQRIISSIIGLPIMILLVTKGGLPLLISVYSLSIIGMNELYCAFFHKKLFTYQYWALFCITVYYFMLGNFISPLFRVQHFSILIFSLGAIFIISNLMFLVIFHKKINIANCATVIFGFFYVGFLMSFIFLVRQYDYGQFFVWLIFISAWGCDTGAYFVGTLIGRHKLILGLSPKKTVEGAIGGIVCSGALAYIYGVIISKAFAIEDINITLFCMVIGCIGAIFAQFGDLSASAIKRYTKIKDFGNIIPGHGGVIDRFDSVLFTAPIVYVVMILLLNIW